MYAEALVLSMVAEIPREIAGPPGLPAIGVLILLPPPLPPMPMMKPLLTNLMVSPAANPVPKVRAGLAVLVEYTYTPELTYTVRSVIPAM
jgi:hypothetical protein